MCTYKTCAVILLLLLGGCEKEKLISPSLPEPDHIVIVIMENHSYYQVLDSVQAPFIYRLANGKHSALFTHSYALGHPSQPNYLQLFSGSNQNVTDDFLPTHHFTTPNLGAQLIAEGKSFISYSEGLPWAGFDGEISGRYVRKHNPVTNWMGEEENQVDSLVNQPFSAFPENYDALPTVCYIIPDLDHDMHDGTIATADEWLRMNVSGYIHWTLSHNSIFILTFDEVDYDTDENHILTFFTGNMIKSGMYDEQINHYNLLRTIEKMYHLPYAGEAGSCLPISDCWQETF